MDEDFAEWQAAQATIPTPPTGGVSITVGNPLNSDPDFAEWQAAQATKTNTPDSNPFSWDTAKNAGDMAVNLGKSASIGATDLLGLLADYNPVGGVPGIFKPEGEAPSDILSGLREEYIGDPTYTSTAGRVAGKVAEYLPSAAIPMGGVGIAGRGLLAALSGAGGGLATEAGLPEWSGALAAPLLTGFKSALSVPSQAARAKASALNVVKKFLDPEEVIESVAKFDAAEKAVPYIQRQSDSYLPNYMRTAEVSQVPGASALEQALLRSEPKTVGAVATLQDEAREAARKTIFDRAAGPVESKGELAATIRNALSENFNTTHSKVGELADSAMKGGEEIVISPIKRALTGRYNTLTKSGARDVTPEFKGLIERFRDLPPKVDLQTLQEYRSTFGEFAKTGAGATTTERMTAKIATTLRKTVDSGIDVATENGSIPKAQAKAWKQMIGERKYQGATFEEGAVGKVLEKTPYNSGYKLTGEDVGKTLLDTKESVTQAVTALKGKGVGRKALAKSLMQDIWDRSTNAMTEKFNPTAFHRQLRKISEIEELALTKQQRKALEIVAKDLKSPIDTKNLAFKASNGNSITSQANSQIELLQNSVKREAGGLIESGFTALNPILGRMYRVVSSVASDPVKKQELINRELAKFVLNKDEAVELLKLPSHSGAKETLTRFLDHLKASVPSVTDGGKTRSAKPSYAEAKPEERKKLAQNIKPPSTEGKESKPIDDAMDRAQSRIEAGKSMKPVKADVDLDTLAKAVTGQESGGNVKAVSTENDYMKAKNTGTAKGLMQLLDSTGKEWHARLKIKEPYDPFNGEQNLKIGKAFLGYLVKKYKGDKELALTAYHSGEGTVDKLLKRYDATTLSEIRPYLGSVGKKYAKQVLQRLPKITQV